MVRQAYARGLQRLLCRFSLLATLSVLFPIAALSLWPKDVLEGYASTEIGLHVLAYALAVVPMSSAPNKAYFWGALLALAWGLALEFLKPAVGLDASLGNLIANSIGIMFGLMLGRSIQIAIEAATKSH